MAAARSPLRRWKRFFPAFAAIDAAIESATGRPRGEVRSVRSRIAGLLHCAEDDGVAEELCAALDGAMEEALATLRVAAASAPPPPTATGLAQAVLALAERHESARVRGLARDVVRRWTAAAEADLARALGLLEMLNKLQNEPRIPKDDERDAPVAAGEGKERHALPAKKTKMAPAPVRSNTAEPANGGAAVKVAAAPSLNNKSAQVKMEEKTGARWKAPGGGNRVQQSEQMMEATKRKLREGYQQAEDAKRQRKIQVIEAPKMLEQRQKKMHPILRERSRARCGSSLAVRRPLLPSLQRI
ncbi:unnamed protein product [Urochloa humidicola]